MVDIYNFNTTGYFLYLGTALNSLINGVTLVSPCLLRPVQISNIVINSHVGRYERSLLVRRLAASLPALFKQETASCSQRNVSALNG